MLIDKDKVRIGFSSCERCGCLPAGSSENDVFWVDVSAVVLIGSPVCDNCGKVLNLCGYCKIEA